MHRLSGRLRVTIALALCLLAASCRAAYGARDKPLVSAQVIAKRRALAERALLRERDFPAGYSGGARNGEQEESDGVNTLLHEAATGCLHLTVPSVTPRTRATVWSGEFVENKNEGSADGYVHIENTVTVEPSLSAAKTWFSIFAARRAATCLGEAIRSAYMNESPRLPGNSVSPTRVEPLNLPRVGEQSTAFRLTTPLTAEHGSYTAYRDFMLIRNGRAHTLITFEKLDAPVAHSLEQHLADVTAKRLKN